MVGRPLGLAPDKKGDKRDVNGEPKKRIVHNIQAYAPLGADPYADSRQADQ